MRRPPLFALGLALGIAALAGIAFAGAPAVAAELTVVIDKLRSAEGTVHIALWDRAQGFTEEKFALIRTERPAATGQVRFDLGRLAPGRYALASFHDENGNGEFDQTWIGWPDEGLGFSNGAWIGFGPPSFEAAAFEVRAGSQIVLISLRYPAAPPTAKRTLAKQ